MQDNSQQNANQSPSERCALCEGPWHESTGSLVGSPSSYRACGTCVLELIKCMKDHTGRGGKRYKGWRDAIATPAWLRDAEQGDEDDSDIDSRS